MSDYGRLLDTVGRAHAALVDSVVPYSDRVYNATVVLSQALGVDPPEPAEPVGEAALYPVAAEFMSENG